MTFPEARAALAALEVNPLATSPAQQFRFCVKDFGEILDKLEAANPAPAACCCGDGCSDEGARCWNCVADMEKQIELLKQRLRSALTTAPKAAGGFEQADYCKEIPE